MSSDALCCRFIILSVREPLVPDHIILIVQDSESLSLLDENRVNKSKNPCINKGSQGRDN
jgi:hypothetical protein